MKKRLGIILAILLCVLLVFTLVACGDKGGGNESTTTDSTITEAQKATATTKIQGYLDSWAEINATEELIDQSAMLSKDLKKNKSSFAIKGDKSYPVNITKVKFNAGTYTVDVSWNEGKEKATLTVKGQTVSYANWAGKNSKTSAYTFQEGEGAVMETVDSVLMAFFNTINDVTANSVTGKFGADGIVGFDAFGKSYGLRVKGNVDLTSKDAKANNELALSVVNGSGNDIAAIYYSGKEDKFYIQYDYNNETVYRYLDYATLFGWVKAAFTDKDGKSTLPTEAGDGVFDFVDEIDGLESLLLAKGVDMAPMITGVVEELAKAYKSADGRVMIDINLSEVMGKVSEIISGLGADFNPEFLQDLGIDLGTMHGLKGHITISAMVKGDMLTDVEVAVNIPRDTKFYRSATDTKPISIPSFGFAIYLKDFSFVTDETIENVLPSEDILKEARYFSPANFDLEGDVYVKAGKVDSTFHFDFVTEINPLEILYNRADSTARAALSIKQNATKGDKAFDAEKATNFLTITYEQETKELCVSGTAFGLDDGTTWYTYAFDSKDKIKEDVMMWLGLTNWIGIDFDMERGIYLDETKENWPAKESAQVIFGDALVQRLMAYFMEYHGLAPQDNGDKDENDGGDASADADPMSLITGYVDAIKDLYNSLIADKVLVISTDPSFSFSLNANQEAIDKVIKAINKTFGTMINEPLKDDEGNVVKDEEGNPIILMEVALEDIKVEINSEGYTKKFVANVKYEGKVFSLTVDTNGKFSVEFSYTGTNKITYSYLFEVTGTLSDWTAKFEYKKTSNGEDSDQIIVKLSNFHGEWGNDNKTEIEEIIPTADAKKAASSIFPKEGTGPATQLVRGLLKLFSANDKVEEEVEEIGRMIIRQIDLKKIMPAFVGAAA